MSSVPAILSQIILAILDCLFLMVFMGAIFVFYYSYTTICLSEGVFLLP
jgi:hypothetical protein